MRNNCAKLHRRRLCSAKSIAHNVGQWSRMRLDEAGKWLVVRDSGETLLEWLPAIVCGMATALQPDPGWLGTSASPAVRPAPP